MPMLRPGKCLKVEVSLAVSCAVSRLLPWPFSFHRAGEVIYQDVIFHETVKHRQLECSYRVKSNRMFLQVDL